MVKKKKEKPSVVLWVKSAGDKFAIDSPIKRERLRQFLLQKKDDWIRMELFAEKRPKSDRILGFWWGAVLPSFVCHNKNIRWKDEPFFVTELLKEKKIAREEIDAAHDTLMTEFRPVMIHELRTGKPTKQRGRMEEMNNTEVVELISEVLDFYADNGYPIPNAEEYKQIRDSALLHKEKKVVSQLVGEKKIINK